MKRNLILVVCIIVMCSWAQSTIHLSVRHPSFADTEIMTNTVLPTLQKAGQWGFVLTGATTPTNNFEVAFGRDANQNGVLDVKEIDVCIGWDCGNWFYRNFQTNQMLTELGLGDRPTQTLRLNVKVNQQGVQQSLSVGGAEQNLFERGIQGAPLELYCPQRNTLRLASRGLTNPTVSMHAYGFADPFILILR